MRVGTIHGGKCVCARARICVCVCVYVFVRVYILFVYVYMYVCKGASGHGPDFCYEQEDESNMVSLCMNGGLALSAPAVIDTEMINR